MRIHSKIAFLLLGSIALFSSAAEAQQVLVVDGSGTGDATSIADAIQIANNGDLILVESGTYDGFTIQEKSLQVRASPGADVVVEGRVLLRELNAQQPVVLEGLTLNGANLSAFGSEFLRVVAPDAFIWIVDCRFEQLCKPGVTLNPLVEVNQEGTIPSMEQIQGYTAFVRTEGVVQDCTPFLLSAFAPALNVIDASVHSFESTWQGNQASPALTVTSFGLVGSAWLSNTHLLGGDGFASPQCDLPVNGGPAANVQGTIFSEEPPRLAWRSSTFEPGVGTTDGCGLVGFDPSPIQAGAGALLEDLGDGAISVSGPLQVAPNTPFDWNFSGPSGAVYGLAVSARPGTTQIAPAFQPLLLQEPFALRFLGNLDTEGQATRSLIAPAPTGPFLSLFTQAFAVESTGSALLGTPMPILVR